MFPYKVISFLLCIGQLFLDVLGMMLNFFEVNNAI